MNVETFWQLAVVACVLLALGPCLWEALTRTTKQK